MAVYRNEKLKTPVRKHESTDSNFSTPPRKWSFVEKTNTLKSPSTSDTVVSSLVLRPVKLVSHKQVLESGECDKILKDIDCSFLENDEESSENVILPDSQSIEISLRKKRETLFK